MNIMGDNWMYEPTVTGIHNAKYFKYDREYNLVPIYDDSVVEVVRCKDCKYYKRESCLNEDMPICGDDMTSFNPEDNFYCKYGERKETE